MRRAICPGSFDPVTYGHLDVISRTAGLFDEVIVGVLVNEAKRSLFTVDERIELLGNSVERLELDNVTIVGFSGLLVDFCRERDVHAIVKGLRAVSDFDFEVQMAQMNQNLSGIDTVFMPTSPEWSFLASSLVKEVARFGGDVSQLVPSDVLARLHEKFGAWS